MVAGRAKHPVEKSIGRGITSIILWLKVVLVSEKAASVIQPIGDWGKGKIFQTHCAQSQGFTPENFQAEPEPRDVNVPCYIRLVGSNDS